MTPNPLNDGIKTVDAGVEATAFTLAPPPRIVPEPHSTTMLSPTSTYQVTAPEGHRNVELHNQHPCPNVSQAALANAAPSACFIHNLLPFAFWLCRDYGRKITANSSFWLLIS